MSVDPKHVKFADDEQPEEAEEDGQVDEEQQATTAPAPAPRGIYTVVELYDDYYPKLKRRKNERTQSGDRTDGTSATEPDTPRAKGKKRAEGATGSQGAATRIEVVQKRYDEMPAFVGRPAVGQVIAYKVLELSFDYQPVLSDFKVNLSNTSLKRVAVRFLLVS